MLHERGWNVLYKKSAIFMIMLYNISIASGGHSWPCSRSSNMKEIATDSESGILENRFTTSREVEIEISLSKEWIGQSKSKKLLILKNKSLTSPYKMAPRPLGNINETENKYGQYSK